MFRRLLEHLRPDVFGIDRHFVKGFGSARSVDDLNAALDDFLHHPENRRWLRRSFKLRLSTRRFLEIAGRILPELKAINASIDRGEG